MLFHSSELLPGGSPYHRDAAAVERFYDTFSRVVDHIIGRLGAVGMTYAEYAVTRADGRPPVFRGRNPRVVTPREFDLSPYFEIVKLHPFAGRYFDYSKIHWADEPVRTASER